MHGISCPVVTSSRVLVVGLSLALLLPSGCQMGETWAPKLPKFGGSNLAFGSKPKEAIEPPALSFKPGEANKQPSIGNSTQLATDTRSGSTPPRAPYTFQEANNSTATASTGLVPAPTRTDSLAGSRPGQGLPNLGSPSSGVSSSPPASALPQLPPTAGGVSQVGYERAEPTRSPANPVLSDSSLAGLNNSVVNSPLLPGGQNPSSHRDIRGIPGGSLGNPLGSNTVSTSTSSPLGAGGLPPAPARGPAPSNNFAQPNPASTQLGLPSPAPNHQAAASGLPTVNSSSGFRPGSVGTQAQPNPTPNYRQTQHGAFPGLPAWPGSNSGSTAPVSTPAAVPSQPTGTLQPVGAGLPGLPGSLPPVGHRTTSGSPALPSFPGAGNAPGQVVCEGGQCIVR